MTLTESIVEDAALTRFGELSYAVVHEPQMASCEPAAERDSFGQVVLVGQLREAVDQSNPPIPQSRTTTLRDKLPQRLRSGVLGVLASRSNAL